MSPERLLGIGATIVIIAAIITGLLVIEGPGTARAERFDRERITNLDSLAQLIDSQYQTHGALPEDFTAFADEANYDRFSTDPRTGEPYLYEILSETSYRLCATFETEGPHEFTLYSRIAWEGEVYRRAVEPHAIEGAGQKCFVVTIAEDK